MNNRQSDIDAATGCIGCMAVVYLVLWIALMVAVIYVLLKLAATL